MHYKRTKNTKFTLYGMLYMHPVLARSNIMPVSVA